MDNYYIGIDPGFKNLGIVALRGRVEYEGRGPGLVEPVYAQTIDLSKCSVLQLPAVCDQLVNEAIRACPGAIRSFGIERYVSYEGVNTAEFENISVIIGMIRHKIHTLFGDGREEVDVALYRAVEWKTQLVQQMSSRLGYTNPGLTLDKKFSLDAAKFLSGGHEKISNTHTADAADIAALELLKRESFPTQRDSKDEFSL